MQGSRLKAIVNTEYGAPEVLHLKNIDKPIPKQNEILIKVHATEATKSDCELRSFNFPVKWFWLPLRIALGITKPKRQVLGGYFSGVIESISDRSRWQYRNLCCPNCQGHGRRGDRSGQWH